MEERKEWYTYLPEGTKNIVDNFEEYFVDDGMVVVFRGLIRSVFDAGKDQIVKDLPIHHEWKQRNDGTDS